MASATQVSHTRHAAPSAGGADRAVLRLVVRLVRRGALLLALGLALFALAEAVSYTAAYPDAASRARIGDFQDSPVVRMLQGVPHAVDTVGGFTVWDGGWMMQSIAAVWALLVTGRLLRGEEEAERAEFVLAGPVGAGRVLLLQFLVIGGALLLAGAAVAATLSAAEAAPGGSVIFGLGIAGFAGAFAGVTAVFAQLFPMRRKVTSLAAVALGLFYALRLVANSDDSLAWLHWATPYGWMDELHAYRDPNGLALALLLLTPVVLAVVAARLRLARDTGGSLLAREDSRPPRNRLLGGPTAFAWRTNQGMLLGWTAGVSLYALLTGLLVDAVAEFIAEEPAYRATLEAIGWDTEKVVLSYIGMMGMMLGLFTALYACWRLGAARAEESTGRLDAVLTRPVSREHWLGGHLFLTLLGVLLITLASALAMWAGTRLSGGGLSLADALAATLNALPVIAFFTGTAVLVYGLAPRLTVALPVTAAFTTYLMEMIGPGLDWPERLLSVSPFHHLEPVPAEPFAALPAAVLTALALLLTALGLLAFHHRDLTGD